MLSRNYIDLLSSTMQITTQINCIPFKWNAKHCQLIKIPFKQLWPNLIVILSTFIRILFLSFQHSNGINSSIANKILHSLALGSYSICFLYNLAIWWQRDKYMNFINQFFKFYKSFGGK